MKQLADGRWHSGEALAEAAGVSRAAVWKQLQKARDMGLDVQSVRGRGYRLSAPFQPLDAQAIAKCASAGRPSLKVEVLSETESTNKQLMASADTTPRVLFAEYQSGGRGRRGRQWVSPYGSNLCLSLLWIYPDMPANLGALSLAIGVAVARVLSDRGCDGVGLKWPNDLVWKGRKLGGILIEHQSETDGSSRVVVGLGLNVFMHESRGRPIDQPWIALEELLEDIDRNALAGQLAAGLADTLRIFGESGLTSFTDDWRRFDAVAGQSARVLLGQEDLPCTVTGIGEDGALLVRDAAGETRRFYAGEVSLRAE